MAVQRFHAIYLIASKVAALIDKVMQVAE